MTEPPSTLALADVRRFSRQIALPEVGVHGQSRICQASALVVAPGGDRHAGAAAAAEYLLAAGVRGARILSPDAASAVAGDGWLAALEPVSVAIRFGLDDDAFLGAAVRLGRPALVLRAHAGGVDLLSFRRHGPCPHRSAPPALGPGAPSSLAEEPETGLGAAALVVAGTLAASEALLLLAAPESGPRARLLRLGLDDGAVTHAALPWAPECFRCGGNHQEASFA